MKASELLKIINENLEHLREINDDKNFDPDVIILNSKGKSKEIVEIDICEKFDDPEEKIYISHSKIDLSEEFEHPRKLNNV
jgi:hypothetical protein